MKKFWLIVLSLVMVMVMAFSVSAFAADVKFSGEYYAAGAYLSKNNVKDDDSGNGTAFFYQRLRVGTDFIIDPALKLVTRFDVMERVWGASRSASGTTNAADSYETAAENENIAFDWVYINYKSPIGTFDAGIMNDGSTGTIFGNSYAPAARIKYGYSFDPFTLALAYTKAKEQNYSVQNPTANFSDGDNDKYGIEGAYKWKDGKAGMQVNYYNYADKRPSSDYKKQYLLFTPYAMTKLGPVALQAELNYATGKAKKYDNDTPDVDLQNISAFVDAAADFAPFYVGASLAYISGDDPGTSDKEEGGTLNGGRDWNPCLLLFNYYDAANWVGTVSGYDSSKVTGPMSNALFGQIRAGVKPMPELDVMMSVSYAKADEKPAGYVDDQYGMEVDLTGTYKITNNLSYMLGVGYLFTGDYYKGTSESNEVKNDYIVMNKITLAF